MEVYLRRTRKTCNVPIVIAARKIVFWPQLTIQHTTGVKFREKLRD